MPSPEVLGAIGCEIFGSSFCKTNPNILAVDKLIYATM